MKTLSSTLLLFGVLVSHAQTFVDDFDSGDINDRWLVQRNAVGSVEIVQEDGHGIVTATGANANGGLASVTTFDPLADGIFVTFVVSEVIGGKNANGFLVGVVDDNTIFHRNTNNFGIAAFGQEGRTFSSDGFSLIAGDRNAGGESDWILDEGEAVDRASFEDGFIITLSADDAGWTYMIEGLQDIDGTDQVYENTGTWADAGTSFQEIFGEDNTWHVLTADQSPGDKVTRFDQISLGDPKPSSDPEIRVASTLALGQFPSVPELNERTLTVRNAGEAQTLELSNIEISGPDADHFSLATDQFPVAIAPGETAEVVFAINNLGETGEFQSVFSVLTNDPAPVEDSRVDVEVTASVINLNGPIAHYPMNEEAGADMRDVTGFGRSGLFGEGVTLGAESLAGGKAIRVSDGASASVAGRAFDDAAFGEFSISLWFQADSVEPIGTLIANGQEGSPAFALLVDSGQLSWFVDTAPDLVTSDAGLEANQAHHAVVTFKSDEAILYVDGTPKGSNTSPLPLEVETTAPLLIGSFGPLGFTGSIDDVQLYGRVISPADVQFLHDNPGVTLGASSPVDSDGDGLTDEEEVTTHQTDPLISDTDGDGLNDGDEVAANSNPLVIDTDGGGTWDGFEVANGTDPNNASDDPAVWSVRTLKSRSTLTTIAQVDALITDSTFSSEILKQHTLVNFVGSGEFGGNFENDLPFDNIETTEQNVDDFAILATTEIFVSETGTYTFGFNSDDGGRLSVDDATVALFDGTRGSADTLGTISLTTGFHTVDVLMFERGGGASLEVYWAPKPGDSSDAFDSATHQLLAATSFKRADSDGDGLDDQWEIALFDDLSNDGSADTDDDGLTDLAEHDRKTDPTIKDTDSDGLEDGPEVNTHQTNPLSTDTDGDLRSDGDEVAGNPTSDPLKQDTDGDGFRDGFEAVQNSDPNDAASLPADRLGEPDESWHIAESLPTFDGYRGGLDSQDVTLRVFIDFSASGATEDEREMIWESGGGTVGFSLVYESGNRLVLRGVGNGGINVATVEHTLTATQLAAGSISVIATFDIDNGNPEAAQTIALYLDDVLVGEDSQDMDPDWTGSNEAAFGVASTAFAAGGDNTSLSNGIDFTSGTIDLTTGLQIFTETLFTLTGDGGPVDPPQSDVAIKSITRTNSAITLTVVDGIGSTADVEYSTNLTPDSWEVILSDVQLTNAIEDTDADRVGAAQGFYRLVAK